MTKNEARQIVKDVQQLQDIYKFDLQITTEDALAKKSQLLEIYNDPSLPEYIRYMAANLNGYLRNFVPYGAQ